MQSLREHGICLRAAPLDLAVAPSAHGRSRRALASAAGLALARNVLETATGIAAADWTIAADDRGRPGTLTPDGRPGPDLSIAHSRARVACAVVLNGRIGVDIEESRAGRPYAEMAADFSQSERTAIARDGEAAFLVSWVIREAIGKAEGIGLARALTLDGPWIPQCADTTRAIELDGVAWIVGHRRRGAVHLAIAWRGMAASAANVRQADEELEAAAGALDTRSPFPRAS